MNVNCTAKVDGFYEVGVRRNAASGNADIEWTGEHKNLLLDGFFTRWLGGSIANSNWRFFVGTGTTAAAAGQTVLDSQVGPASNSATVTENNTVLEASDYIASSTGIAQWAIGAIVANISEVGANLRNVSTGLDLDSRALIVDDVGETRTMPVTAGDQLVVRYTLRYRIPIAQHVSVVDFGGVSTTCTLETLNALGSAWHLRLGALSAGVPHQFGSITVSSSATLANNVTSTTPAGSFASVTYSYSSNGIARVNTISASSSQLNAVVPIKYIQLNTVGGISQGILFDPPIAKDNTKTLTLNFDYTLARA